MFKLVVLFCTFALAAAKPSYVEPWAYSAVVGPAVTSVVTPGVSSVSQYSNSVVHGSPVVPAVYGAAYAPVASAVYPIAQAPGSPAVVLDAVNGVPLDTPEVVAARAAHYQAKVLSGAHVIAKRSLAAVSPYAYSSVVSPVYPSTYSYPGSYVPAYGAQVLVVLSCVLAAASAQWLSPIAYAAPFYQPSIYRGPLSLAPGQPANILGSDGRPLDTLDVNLDRAAHLTTKALDGGVHLLKKRSTLITPYASLVAPLAYSTPLLQPYNYRGPLSLAPGQPADILAADGRPLDTLDVNLDRAAHYTAKALDGAHLLKKRSVALVSPLSTVSHVSIARGPLVHPTLAYSAPVARLSHITYATPFLY
ncbi:unnamed protein product [Leptidea sinapis]|uniref:Cuticle protein n=1 Tax=Leptidea sinapis TaxID=189913 RepID=A0A5E4QSH7_9NEOP|nr:unnamed protein product [Leptidea sinapis]